MGSVITEGITRDVLLAGRIHLSSVDLPTITERLDAAAWAFIHAHNRNRRDERGRLRSLPPKEARRNLYGDLIGIWIELPEINRLPGVTFSFIAVSSEQWTGRFVGFTQAFAGAVADYVSLQAGESEDWRGLIKTLRRIQTNGVNVRDGLRAVGIPAFVKRFNV